ncbi:MAG: glucoamylase family protein [Acholeplasma sp.]|nr:glucoamylase family protein [Acholeplasma sp.]
MHNKIEMIQKTAFNYFEKFTNLDEDSAGYGLTVDHSNNLQKASIAATGFTLSSYIVGDKYKYITNAEARKRVLLTLKTLYYNVDHFEGFFSHYVDIKNGKRFGSCEYSTIDTALALNGILACVSYFNDKEISEYGNKIFKRVNWRNFFHKRNDKLVLHMAYNDNENGDYAEGKAGYIHHWGMFAEQLMMYLFVAGNSDYNEKEAHDLYQGFEKNVGRYKNHEFIFSPGNTLFIYQYPLAWLDVKEFFDQDGINWFINSKNATLAQYEWCQENTEKYPTYKNGLYGLTASDTIKGYSVFHALPNDKDLVVTDGTVAPNAIIGSLSITNDIALKGIDELFKIKGLWNEEFGFVDAFNITIKQTWISNRFITIDKGLELLMANAYLSQDVQKAYMNNDIIGEGMRRLKWKKQSGGKRL